VATTRTLAESPTKALRKPFKMDLHYVTAALVILTSIVLGVVTLGGRDSTRGIVVATRELPAGATLAAGDLAETQGHLDDAVYAAALPGSAAADLVGRRLVEPVHARQILVRAQIGGDLPLKPDEVAMSISVKNESAAGGQIRVGDAVRVIATVDKGQPDDRTTVVVERAIVYGVGRDERAGAISASGNATRDTGGPLTSLTLVVTADQALRIATVKHGGELDVVLLPPAGATGAPSPQASPTPTASR
jgi:Flp pilus assembly protein CpaB